MVFEDKISNFLVVCLLLELEVVFGEWALLNQIKPTWMSVTQAAGMVLDLHPDCNVRR